MVSKNISEDEIVFLVEGEKLISMVNNGTAKSVVIPGKFASGTKITAIDENVCKGKFEKITISDEITHISEDAFAYSSVKEIHWGKGCRIIPKRCFFNSNIRTLSGIEDVEVIECDAFMETRHLKKLRWPDKCKIIPDWCFYDSAIEEVLNIDNITKIGKHAFFQTGLKEFKWPTGCERIPESCFSGSTLEEISNIEEIKTIEYKAFFSTNLKKFYWPQKCKKIPERCFCACGALTELYGADNVEEIGDAAFERTDIQDFVWPAKCSVIPHSCFYGSSIKAISNIQNVTKIGQFAFGQTEFDTANKLDLSQSIISIIGESAFAKLRKEAVVLPYYFAGDIEQAFIWM